MVSGGFRLDLLLETATFSSLDLLLSVETTRWSYDKDKEIKELKFKQFIMSIKEIMAIVRMTLELRNRGFVVNHKKVQRLMKAPWFKCSNSS